MFHPEIIYKDENVVAVNKPAGLLVHGAQSANRKAQIAKREPKSVTRYALGDMPETTLVDWLLKKYPEIKTVGDDPNIRPGIVHRLDKDTSGVMLVARNQESFLYLKSLFAKHEIQKTYYALVYGDVYPKTGVIDAPIGIRSGTLKRSVRSKKMAKPAITRYHVLKEFASPEGKFSLLEVMPETGRTHQIRVHLASIGNPVVGDQLYGKAQSANRPLSQKLRRASKTSEKNDLRNALGAMPRLMLHAFSLEFRTSEKGSRIRIDAEPPRDFENIVRELQRQ